MRSRSWYWVPVGFLLALWLAVSAPRSEAGRVSCSSIVSEVTRETRGAKDAGQSHVDISQVARKLGTTVAWTEHCMRVYGRRPRRPGLESAESREAELEAFEEDEPEETFPEDTEEPGAPNPKLHAERPRVLKIKPPPTPRVGQESEEGLED